MEPPSAPQPKPAEKPLWYRSPHCPPKGRPTDRCVACRAEGPAGQLSRDKIAEHWAFDPIGTCPKGVEFGFKGPLLRMAKSKPAAPRKCNCGG